MIRYALLCDQDHPFESWFESSKAFDKLQAGGLVECPHCGSHNIRKALMTPQIGKKGERPAAPPAEQPGETDTGDAKTLMTSDPRLAELHAEALEIARKIRNHIRDNAEYVGDRFAEEARKIHFEEVEARGIYGEASGDEVKDLLDDGIEVHPLPRLPEDGN